MLRAYLLQLDEAKLGAAARRDPARAPAKAAQSTEVCHWEYPPTFIQII